MSIRPSAAIKKPAKYCVSSASAESTAHHSRSPPPPPRFQARAKNSSEAVHSAISSMYSRASCEYQIMNGLTAANAAATSPARRETSSRPQR